MTTAKFVTSPAEGHGITSKLTDPLYHALANGKPVKPLVTITVWKPVGLGQRETARGRHQHVQFEAMRCEVALDSNMANELLYLAQGLYEQRTSNGEQRPLPLGLGSDEEKRMALMERMEDWAKQNVMTASELEARWRAEFGAESDSDWSFGDQGVPGDYRKASYAHLTSFCYSTGILSLDGPLPHEDREDDDDDGADDRDVQDAADDAQDPANAQVSDDVQVGVTCEVCRKKSDALTDGLCPKCAKNAGVPVAAEHQPEPATA